MPLRGPFSSSLPPPTAQLTTSTFEEVSQTAPDNAKGLQLYVWRDRVLLKEVRPLALSLSDVSARAR